jgi:septal ring factor EnvC (AmiA/AmiB activator)
VGWGLNQQKGSATAWTLGATGLTVLGGLLLFGNQLTFDSELAAAETRLTQASDNSDRRILEDLLAMQQVLIRQQQQQFLTLRRDLLSEQIARLWEAYLQAPADEQDSLGDNIDDLKDRLRVIEDQLEQLLTQPVWMKPKGILR